MSGISDLPFRRLAHRLGAGLVISEMIASEALVAGRDDTMLRATGAELDPFAIQLSGREPRWMAEGARIATSLGAQIIDINMGCPAKQVTRGLSGSALMRDLDHALTLIDATVAATELPVTLKMRMGWDHETLNAPELAKRAEAAGVQMITVHGRTRCQFFDGSADWRFIAKVKHAVTIPVIANGDVTSPDDASEILRHSTADGLMIGRGACGAPWLPGLAAKRLAGQGASCPTLGERIELIKHHYDDILCHYGRARGVRTARKHLAWYIDALASNVEQARRWRARICRQDDPNLARRALAEFFDSTQELAA